MRLRLAMLTVLLAVAPALAEVKPHTLCTEGMVLQQGTKAKIWGTAAEGEKVTVKFRDHSESTEAKDGHWVVAVDTGAAGGPFPLTIAGTNTIEFKDVLVGEVWVASGQSNMEWQVQSGKNQSDIGSATGVPANPMIRMFTVQKNTQAAPVADVKGSWISAKPDTVLSFSSCGYFFARDLNKALNVPVGIIHTSWGGTRAEAWTSGPVLSADPRYKTEVENFHKAYEAFKSGAAPKPADTKKAGPKANAGPMNANSPSVLYNGMVAPILNYAIKGAIWYQGESNAGKAYDYRTLFPMMIKNWRDDWKIGDFPFIFVQLAPFGAAPKEPGESNWAELREAQTMTLQLPNTGMAVITDVGNEYDIHPTPKEPVGARLALSVLANVYGKKVEFAGPMYKAVKIDGSKAILTFDHVGGGLTSHQLVPTLEKETKNGKMAAWRVKPDSAGAPLVGFTVCGDDKKFHPAKAEIVGETVVVTCPDVSTPVAVRYGWANHPICNLFNKAGLPASPFRTDDFPGVTVPKAK